MMSSVRNWHMKLYTREKYLKKIRSFYDADDIIKVITGIRRCGKSCLMQSIAEELLKKGVKEENILYIDLDKRGFRRIKTAEQLEQLIDDRLKSSGGGLRYLFIDEIQNVQGFEELINGYRTDGDISIFITGSNSYLLSGEIMTKLTGRYLEFEMFTLTFDEYLDMKRFYKKQVSSDLLAELNNYIIEGGFPRTMSIDDPDAKRVYVDGVVREIFEKDIRSRLKIKDSSVFEAVQNFVINNFGATMSIKSICDGLKQTGVNTTRATVSRYIKALADAKIIYECRRFDMKSRRSLVNEKKYYLADLGIYYSLNVDNRINYGPNLENIVYIYARSFDNAVSVGRIGRLECDFIMRSRSNDYAYVQVAYTILSSRETEDREYRSLESIKDNYPKYVVTTDGLLQKRNGIRNVNLMSYISAGRQFC